MAEKKIGPKEAQLKQLAAMRRATSKEEKAARKKSEEEAMDRFARMPELRESVAKVKSKPRKKKK